MLVAPLFREFDLLAAFFQSFGAIGIELTDALRTGNAFAIVGRLHVFFR